MPNTILLPLDGSPLAETAVPYAEELARTTEGHIVAVCVIPAPIHGPLFTQAESYLEAVASRLCVRGLSVETRVLAGSSATAILREAHARSVSLIALSSHHQPGIARWIHGTVADQVFRQASVPVLVTAHPGTWLGRKERFKRVLVPLDGSVLGETALDTAREFSDKLDAEIVLIRVVEPLFYGLAYCPPIEPSRALGAAKNYLNRIAERLRSGGSRVTIRVEYGQAIATIAQVAMDSQAGLIVMAAHRRRPVGRRLLGSVASGVLQRAGVPFLLARPAGTRIVDVPV